MASNDSCQYVNSIVGSQSQCEFVQQNEDCQDSDGYLNYVEIIYCDFVDETYILPITLYALWLIVLFIALAVSADDFFCPNLASISKTLR